MNINTVWHIVGWTLATFAAAAGAYVCYKKSDRLKTIFKSHISRHDKAKRNKTTRLANECWETYVQLQTILTRKDAYRKSIAGDTGIMTALSKLKGILESGRDESYMAIRIKDQICGFISNTLIARGIIGVDEIIKMPEPEPSLMERDIYFRNITVSPAEQTEKYIKVADYQRSRINEESSETRFEDTLRDLLPYLKQAYDLAEGNTMLSTESTVAWGREFLEKTSQIIEKYEK